MGYGCLGRCNSLAFKLFHHLFSIVTTFIIKQTNVFPDNMKRGKVINEEI